MSKVVLIIVTVFTFLAGVTAESKDFAVSIVGLRESNNLQFSREGLPIVYYAGPAHSAGLLWNEPSEHSFFVVVQNVQKVADKMAVSASAWYDCLRFTIKTSSGKTYSVSRLEFAWTANPIETWIFPSGGMRIIPVDFANPYWKELPPTPSEPEVVTMTVTFRYPDSNGNWVSVASAPTDVYLCAK
jgi:hypothetical protein